MFLMQKPLFFASALNKGSYGFNGFGHNIVLEDFFEEEGAEPPRKKVCVVKSVPMTVGKKVQTATNVARKSVPTAAAGKPSTSTSEQDPDYEPDEVGAGESDDDSDTEDVINPISMNVMQLILQMDITTPRQVSRHVQPKINATVASNLPPQTNSRHMRNNMPDRCGHVLSVIKSQKAMTNIQFTSTTGPSTKGGTCTSALLTHAQLMATIWK